MSFPDHKHTLWQWATSCDPDAFEPPQEAASEVLVELKAARAIIETLLSPHYWAKHTCSADDCPIEAARAFWEKYR